MTAVVCAAPEAVVWQRTTLGALSEYVTSGSRDWKQYYADHGALFIRTQDIASNRLNLENVPRVALPKKVEGKRSLVKRGDLLITITGNVGRVAVVDLDLPEAYVSQSVCLVRLRDPSFAPFLRHQLLARQGGKTVLEAMAYGLGRAVLNLENIRSAQILLAPPAARERIVAEIERQFSRLDAAVACLKRVITRLTGYRERVLDDAFAAEPNAALGELISEGPQNGLYLPKDAYGSGAPIVRIDDYQTGWMRPVEELCRVRATDSQVSTWALQPGDLLVNRVNSMSHLGKCAVIPKALAGSLFESNMMRFSLAPGVLPRYVELYLGSRIGKRRLTSNAKWAVNQASINQKDVQATEIPLPSPERQVQIVAEIDRRLSIVREVGAEVDANLKRAQALRRAVLAHAFVPSDQRSDQLARSR